MIAWEKGMSRADPEATWHPAHPLYHDFSLLLTLKLLTLPLTLKPLRLLALAARLLEEKLLTLVLRLTIVAAELRLPYCQRDCLNLNPLTLPLNLKLLLL